MALLPATDVYTPHTSPSPGTGTNHKWDCCHSCPVMGSMSVAETVGVRTGSEAPTCVTWKCVTLLCTLHPAVRLDGTVVRGHPTPDVEKK